MTTPTIGILAGMGAHSTAPFLDLVLAECQAQYGAREDIDFPPIQVLSWPVPFYADRPVDEREVEEATRQGLERLAGCGVSFIGIACNTAHAFFPRLERAVTIPLLDMVALTAESAPAAPARIALVAARSTVQSGIYQRALEGRGHTVLTPPWQDTVDRLIDATRLTERDRRIRDLWDILIQQAKDVGAEGLLVACADLTAVSGSLATPVPLLDSTRLLARGLVRRWLLERPNGKPSSGKPSSGKPA